MRDAIEVGDLVRVDINGAQTTVSHAATVLYIPQAAGDSWHFRCNETGDLIYVSESCTITRHATSAAIRNRA